MSSAVLAMYIMVPDIVYRYPEKLADSSFDNTGRTCYKLRLTCYILTTSSSTRSTFSTQSPEELSATHNRPHQRSGR